jgi:hypothetical protein
MEDDKKLKLAEILKGVKNAKTPAVALPKEVVIASEFVNGFLNALSKDKGETGEVGERGEKGDQGEKGDKGDKGDKGENGKSIKGKDGRDGKDGKDGEKGQDGLDGKDGKNPEPKEIVAEIKKLKGKERIPLSAIEKGEFIVKRGDAGFDMNDQRGTVAALS